MKWVAAGIVLVAVFAGVIFFAQETPEPPPAATQPATDVVPEVIAPMPESRSGSPPRPVTSDPRLAALMVSPENALIEFVAGDNGKVIREIDNDPNSPGYRKPLREYTYAGEQVIGLVSYKYLGDQVQIIRVAITYKPDGRVDKYLESTSYDFGKKH